MTTPFKEVEQSAVDAVLETVTVEPDRYAAMATASRYAHLNAVDRYQGLQGDRYANLTAPPKRPVVVRYDGLRRRPHPKRRVINVYAEFAQPPPEARLYWLPAYEYEQCFESAGDYAGIYPIGALIDFTEAIESNHYHDECNDEEAWWLYGAPVAAEVETHHSCGCFMCEEMDLSDVLEQALVLRHELAADPERFTRDLAIGSRYYIREWAGLRQTPSEDEVLEAVLRDSRTGLGGAALDYEVWQNPADYGTAGERLIELIEQANETGWVQRWPLESFLFREERMHRDTVASLPLWADPSSTDYVKIYGEYVVAGIEYTSDLEGDTIAGWRSLYMEPNGEPRMPDFGDEDKDC